jgi:four helix bundle protein
MKDFKNLKVWSKAHQLTLQVYRVTRSFPKEELFGLVSQMRRSASSVGANIAEGVGRKSDGELTRFLLIARGSATELEYHLLLAHDLNFLQQDSFDELNHLSDEVQRMLTALIQQVQPIPKAKSARTTSQNHPGGSKLVARSS